jgi:hypothetical protein
MNTRFHQDAELDYALKGMTVIGLFLIVIYWVLFLSHKEVITFLMNLCLCAGALAYYRGWKKLAIITGASLIGAVLVIGIEAYFSNFPDLTTWLLPLLAGYYSLLIVMSIISTLRRSN